MRVWLKRQVYRHLTSSARRDQKRRSEENRRESRNEPHRLSYFHRPGDPHSALMSEMIAQLEARYDVKIDVYLTALPEQDVSPEPDRLQAFARRDCSALAELYGLNFTDPGQKPDQVLMDRAASILTTALDSPQALQAAMDTDRALWTNDPAAMEDAALKFGQVDNFEAKKAARAGSRLRDQLGHFQSGSLHYAGEWYWGVDRLHYLEARLKALGVHNNQSDIETLSPPLLEGSETGNATGAVLEVYPSLRSPYSYLAMERAFALAQRWQAQVDIRFVLPMVMRNLPVPQRKGVYFLLDAKREADRLDMPFGNICDPLGKPTERGLAVLHYAISQDSGQSFLTSFLRGVWAEGVNAGSDKGLKFLSERAGLNWNGAKKSLENSAWRDVAEENRTRLGDLGLWGVPSFRVGDFSVWGQDRLWMVEQALAERAHA